jgi:hypothetical protein
MWQLHSGSAEWLARLAATKGWWGCEAYDVADCFLNTPREAVIAALSCWLTTTQKRTRRQPAFAIAKDGKAGDHRGRPASIHYWTITTEQLVAACVWDLENNGAFEAQNVGAEGEDEDVVLVQRKGLPVGGHLSAAYVELVALRREFECVWPSALTGFPTARYRDNFFIVLPDERSGDDRQATAEQLSALLLMPVCFERAGTVARCLELRLSWGSDSEVKAVLAYRTDADRQGESGDVTTWPVACGAFVQGGAVLLAGGGRLSRLGPCSVAVFTPTGVSLEAVAAAVHFGAATPRRSSRMLAQDLAGSAAQ